MLASRAWLQRRSNCKTVTPKPADQGNSAQQEMKAAATTPTTAQSLGALLKSGRDILLRPASRDFGGQVMLLSPANK
jgi:hypothetical protein